MAKVYGFVVASLVMMLMMNMGGVPTAVNSILEWVGLNDGAQNVSTSQFAVAILAIFSTAALTGIVVGFFTRSSPESFIAAGFTSLLAIFAGTFVSVYNYVSQTGDFWGNVLLVIMGPLVVGFFISLISFWRGSDG